MKKVAAFLTAIVLFIVILVGISVATAGDVKIKNADFGTWVNGYKDSSYSVVSKNIKKDSMFILGSSELHHGLGTPFHPRNLFKDEKDMELMLVGGVYNQSLFHTILMGAFEPKIQNKKVVLILSPSWFDLGGISPEGFAVRFSESEYVAMLQNPNISKELKQRIAKRCESLLVTDKVMGKRVKRYNRMFIEGKHTAIGDISFSIRNSFVEQRDKMCVMAALKTKPQDPIDSKVTASYVNYDWEKLSAYAGEKAKAKSTNKFYMIDRTYKTKVVPIKGEREGQDANKSYAKAAEYDDLQLFIDLCKETNIDVKLLLLPVNGYWFDFTGFPKEQRKVLETNILKMGKENNVDIINLFGESYTPYFMEDVVHPGGKGWVKMNEEIYKYYHEN